mmetsp:Transcript_10389/g.16960  ORF Transcript_10389/g.16960 Transcript_10389/m.16960 type:complete len:213 (-) Transcript_10389:643-1281(-)|eukprot:CAMPEP_0184643700 /NCGR_PEP_ID=MMETSP0308-20130426/527_1 /TAXON_ID=38269 /ORGANISM="Gloeochaete witrockiana, Strain SAG 46.84" /LENGTH=212 /DNA_ID=CAMNT_0027071805 /DNA_START=72 /DNA_END=710 /DNA_ORIENTATION=-
MVFFFTSGAHVIFMGEDKYENEKLIRWGWPEDIWFHVDKLSSAHVYIRMNSGETIDDIPPDLLEDCAQLVKQNSIQGCKESNVTVVYTPWANLKKTGSMDVGQVGFFNDKMVRSVKVDKKKNEIINRLEKTRIETHPDFAQQREARDAKERAEKKDLLKKKQHEDVVAMAEAKKVADLKSYTSIMKEEKMKSNKDLQAKTIEDVRQLEEDFL